MAERQEIVIEFRGHGDWVASFGGCVGYGDYPAGALEELLRQLIDDVVDSFTDPVPAVNPREEE